MQDDLEFNVHVCKTIQKYPQIYDYNRTDYSNRSVQDKAWRSISRELNETVNTCKERWRNIRGRYSKYRRTVRTSGSGANQVKEYYLTPHLLFLDKFLKIRTPTSYLILGKSKVEKPDYSASANTDYHELLHEDSSHSSEASSTPQQNSSYISSESPVVAACNDKKKRKAEISIQSANESAFEHFQVRQNVDEGDADMAFLQSLLPDMKAMTVEQKRKFKIGVLMLSDELLGYKPQVGEPLTSDICEEVPKPSFLLDGCMFHEKIEAPQD